MSLHRREAILRAVETAVTDLAVTGGHVYRMRVYPHESTSLPSLNIVQGADTPVDDEDDAAVLPYIDRDLEVRIEYRARAGQEAVEPVDQVLNQMAREVSVALHADHTLGLAYVHNLIEGPTGEPEIDEAAEQLTALMAQDWWVKYRTSRSDPAA